MGGWSLKGLWIGRAVAAIGSAVHVGLVWHSRMRAATAKPQRARLTILPAIYARSAHS